MYTVVVVGGAGVIGSEISRQFLENGVQVAAVGRSRHTLDDFAEGLRQPCRLSVWPRDMTDEMTVTRTWGDIADQCGPVTGLVYSAGMTPDPDVSLEAYSFLDWEATFRTYVTGFFLNLREALRVLPAGGHIGIVSSAVTRFRGDNLPPIHVGHYAAAKAAVDELSKWGRRDAHQRGILLSRIAPAAVDSPFHQRAPSYRRTPALLDPADVASRLVLAFLSRSEVDQMVLPVTSPPRTGSSPI